MGPYETAMIDALERSKKPQPIEGGPNISFVEEQYEVIINHAMSNWHPIETAPKDETPILAYDPHDDLTAVMYWTGETWMVQAGYPSHGSDPSHWMPLPEPPIVR